jgi:hypothetical protein
VDEFANLASRATYYSWVRPAEPKVVMISTVAYLIYKYRKRNRRVHQLMELKLTSDDREKEKNKNKRWIFTTQSSCAVSREHTWAITRIE